MVVITFKSGVTHIYNENSPKLIPLWKKVEQIASVVYGEFQDTPPAPIVAPKPKDKKTKVKPVESSKETIGDFIKAHRSRKGLKQTELLSALNMDFTCNLHRTFKDGSLYNKNFISRVENDRVIPSLFEFQCLLSELDIDNESREMIAKRYYDNEGKYKKPE